MNFNPTSLESLLRAFRERRSLNVADIERLLVNGQNIGMTATESERARTLLRASRTLRRAG